MSDSSQTATLRQLLSGIVSGVPFGIITLTEEHEVSLINAEAAKLLGFSDSNPNLLIDKYYKDVFINISELIDKYERLVLPKKKRKFNLNNISNSAFELNIQCRSMLHGTLVILENITEANILYHKATHDSLTQLVNRQHYEERLEKALAKSIKHELFGAVAFIDLDNFKPVNDTAGHAAGDELLKRISTIIQSRIRNRDTIARIGGDEFALLLEDCPIERAEVLLEQIRSDIERMPFSYNGKVFNITISAGLAPINGVYNDVSTLMNAADTACQVSKDAGRNYVHLINQKLGEYEAHVKESSWLNILNKALTNDSFVLYAQQISSLTDDYHHYEILLRLLNEDGTISSPNSFIPSAERYKLMPKIDAWVIEQAFMGISKGMAYSINLSGQTLSDESLVDYIIDLQTKYKVDAKMITFEITETAAIHNIEQTQDFITQLRAKGFKFALDDFGTGLSSFSYLKNMTVDFLKIDGVFVKDIDTDKISYAMVKSISDVGHSMGLKIIAEFVESKEIFDMLKEMDVDYAQGYYIHKPQPLVDISKTDKVTPLKNVMVN